MLGVYTFLTGRPQQVKKKSNSLPAPVLSRGDNQQVNKLALNCPGWVKYVNLQGWVVQRWVKFNPGFSKNYSSNCFIKKKDYGSYKIPFRFSLQKLVNPKFTGQILTCKIGNKRDLQYQPGPLGVQISRVKLLNVFVDIRYWK